MDLFFVTGNEKKFTEASTIFKNNKFNLKQLNIDLEEYQAYSKEIAIMKCKEVENKNKTVYPFIIEDVSLCFNCLGGMPGPYIKWFLKTMNLEDISKIVKSFDDKNAYSICTIALKLNREQEPIIFEGITKGKIVYPRGETNFGWDPIFECETNDGNINLTYAEMDKEYKNKVSHRCKAFTQLKEFLLKN
jgi:inosine triphosphate pyrophosphatase